MTKYLLVIMALSAVVYANTLHNEFVSDDIPAIVENPDISNLSRIFSSRDSATVTNFLCYRIGRLNPFVYHIFNIILHSLNSVLVFFFLCLFFARLPSFWASLIFAVHPIHTEAVSWVSGRPYLFLAFFSLSSFLFYVRATSAAKLKVKSLIASLLMYVLAIYSDSFSLAYPGMLVLYDFCFGRWKKNWRLWLVFFAVTGLKLWFMVGAIKSRVDQIAVDLGASPTENMGNPFFNLAYSFFSHLGLLFWPQKLTLYHEPPVISYFALTVELILLSGLALAMPFIFKRKRSIFFAICFFILFLAPTYSPVIISWLVAERYVYLPSLALSILAAVLITRYSQTRKSRPALSIVLILLLAAYSLRTIIRNFDWKTHASIWRATLKASPFSHRAHNNMGDVYSREGDFQKAVEEFRRAVELMPNYPDAYHNLAVAYHKLGRIDQALENYQKAVSLNPRLYQSYQNLAYIYFAKGQIGPAKEYLRKILEIKPDDKNARQALDNLEAGRF